ncbi:MAG: phosphopentomutase [bacterium]
MNRRIVLIILDSLGIGDAPDAGSFDTEGSNTVVNISTRVAGLSLPNMERLGLGHIHPILGVDPHPQPVGCYGAMSEVSNAMDTTVGHWEMMGLRTEKPFPTYPNGFPDEVIEPFERAIGRPVLGNKPASGTVIIEELGEEHMSSGSPIVYTSADSVFQIAAHEEVIPVPELYRMCEQAREILTGEHRVSRVIARPFVGKPGGFQRTHRRKDFSVSPPEQTVMQDLKESGYEVQCVGKISDIFNGVGVTESFKTKNNRDGIDKTLDLIRTSEEEGMIFTNLVDFDSKYGHRNNPLGYAQALEEWDQGLEEILSSLNQGDILMITGDHGTDPTTETTDHSRELVPLLVYGPGLNQGVDLGVRIGFYDIGQSILDYFGMEQRLEAKSFWPLLKNGVVEAVP